MGAALQRPGQRLQHRLVGGGQPGGTRVFVTGSSQGTGSGQDSATVAYSAATGAQLWAQRYNGPANGSDYALSVAVSPAAPGCS